MKTNSIDALNWFNRIGLAAVWLVAIIATSVAQGQYVEHLPSTVSHQFSQYASHCQHCEVNRIGAPVARLAQSGPAFRARGGMAGQFFAGAKQNVAMLSHRETPPGNMGQRFPYHATQMYYYRRPYNDLHVLRHVGESRDSSAQSTFGQSLGYSNQIFEQVHKSTERYHNTQHGSDLEKDGLLEFVDWKEHREQRQIWESMPRYQSEYQQRSISPFDEEVRSQRSSQKQLTELGASIQRLGGAEHRGGSNRSSNLAQPQDDSSFSQIRFSKPADRGAPRRD